jgi:GNAT superfamily N-acetyltransferase
MQSYEFDEGSASSGMDDPKKSRLSFDNLRFRHAGRADVEALATLINTVFRVELPFIAGDRTNPDDVREYMKKGKFILAEDSAGLAGCVYVELRGDRGYLGLLGVEPRRQGNGLGRKLMDAAEEFFRDAGCVAVDLRIISARTPLPAFYRHLGYTVTGTAPFPHDVPAKVPCHYILMSKSIAQASATSRRKNEPGSGS